MTKDFDSFSFPLQQPSRSTACSSPDQGHLSAAFIISGGGWWGRWWGWCLWWWWWWWRVGMVFIWRGSDQEIQQDESEQSGWINQIDLIGYWWMYGWCSFWLVVCFQSNRQNLSNRSSTPSDKALRKYEHKINLGKYTHTPGPELQWKSSGPMCLVLLVLPIHTVMTPQFTLTTIQRHRTPLSDWTWLVWLFLSDKLNYVDSVINKVKMMQKQKDSETYVFIGLLSHRSCVMTLMFWLAALCSGTEWRTNQIEPQLSRWVLI